MKNVLIFYVEYLDKFQALIQSKDPNGAAQAKLVRLLRIRNIRERNRISKVLN
jgi:hypothetical protein